MGGIPESDLLGRNVKEMFDGQQAFDMMSVLENKAIEYGECTGKRLNGTSFPIAYSANIVRIRITIPLIFLLFPGFIRTEEDPVFIRQYH